MVGVVLLAAWRLLAVTPSRIRVVVVVVVFAVVGALRPLLFMVSGLILGIGVQTAPLSARIGINIVATVAMFGLIAIGVDLVRDHAGVYRRLRAARRASAYDAEKAAELIRQLRHSSLDAVIERIEDAASMASEPIRPRDAALLLRALADEVVRPVSHRLYEDVDEPDIQPSPEPPLSRREWVVSSFAGVRGAPPLLLAALFAVLVIPFAVAMYGPLVSIAPVAAGLAVLYAGNVLLAQLTSAAPSVVRLVGLPVGYALLGSALALTGGAIIRGMGYVPRYTWFLTWLYPVIALGVSFVASVGERVRVDQEELEIAVQESVAAAARMRAEYDFERGALARLLHSGVQSELIATALMLSADASDDAAPQLRAAVERVRAVLSAPRAEPEAAGRVQALVESWRSAIALETDVGEGVWDRLRDPARCSAVIDTISEGLANAVRHGDGTPVTLQLRVQPLGGLEVVITSGGILGTVDSGIGLRQLAEQGRVALREDGGRIELAVEIP